MIPSDKILPVIGIPRSGTSLVMQTLKLLEVPIAGDKFLKNSKEKWNPLGFWEVPYVVFDGVRELGDYGGKAIKLVSNGFVRTNKALVWKTILCLRCPFEIRQSNKKVNDDNNIDSFSYLLLMSRILELMLDQKPQDWLVVDYEDTLKEPFRFVKELAAFAEVGLNKKAIDNIQPKLRTCEGDIAVSSGEKTISDALLLYDILHNPWNAQRSDIERILNWTKREVA